MCVCVYYVWVCWYIVWLCELKNASARYTFELIDSEMFEEKKNGSESCVLNFLAENLLLAWNLKSYANLKKTSDSSVQRFGIAITCPKGNHVAFAEAGAHAPYRRQMASIL